MRRNEASTGRRLLLLGVALVGIAGLLQAQSPDKTPKTGTPPAATATKQVETPAKPAEATAPAAKLGEKTVAFEMRDKPWSQVLEWLADQTGLAVSTVYKPTGTFTFIAPKSSPQQYT